MYDGVCNEVYNEVYNEDLEEDVGDMFLVVECFLVILRDILRELHTVVDGSNDDD